MKNYRWIVILVNLVLLLAFFTFSVVRKEALLTNGQLVLLELAPVDPRSLIQGDYMDLRYELSNQRSDQLYNDSISKRGYCIVRFDSAGIARPVRLQSAKLPLNLGEMLIRYTKGKHTINIGAESFFFEEGQAEKYVKARYGGVRVDRQGNSLLIGLFDEQKKQIK